ncbi:hypothetical protein [Streptomyces sp. 3214.6]|uniref:hypothetical protein n=1 Tax=Streptomyces sp. 3214.6 TaxID=1882757 RepID=UPI000909CE01|nr:hypothetical protein [Streptomyces sp. 3214.6]SHI65660.1 hypothetical protein SAMN05444521_8154 [Streptomyces sp. 3214.6]
MSTQAPEMKASAKTRRSLDEQLHTLFGRAVKEVRITRVTWPEGKKWVAMVIGTHGREIPVYDGGLHHQAAMVLRDAFPDANWSRAQDYTVAAGVLREHVIRTPSSLRGGQR